MVCSITEVFAYIIGCLIIYKLADYLFRLPRLQSVAGRYIFITGCDTGFGNLLAKRLDGKGCHVIAGCLTEKGETELRKETSSRLKTVALNVSSHESVQKAYELTKSMLPKGKGLWAVVNNAGIVGKPGPVEWLKPKDYLEVLAVNVLGLIDVATTFLPLVKLERGRIVNMASLVGRFSLTNCCPYSVSKFGVEAFSDGLRRQLRPTGVSVHIIEPGNQGAYLTNVDNLKQNFDRAWAEADMQDKHLYEKKVEMFISKACEVSQSIKAQDPKYVVDAYEHAILAIHPRSRYVVGLDAKVLLAVQAVSERLSDSLCAMVVPSIHFDNA